MKHLGSGFTLIELLIAITLAAGVTVAGTLLARSAFEYESRHSERWALQADFRNSRLLLEHYWPRRLQDKFIFTPQNLLLYLSEGGKYRFVGFACEGMDTGHGSFALYRWLATHEEAVRVQDGGVWPMAARQTLINDLEQCRFSLMQPPPVDDPESSPSWVDQWVHRDKPDVLRFDAASARGGVAPPLIINAATQ